MDWLSTIWIFREIIRPILDIFILSFLIYKSYQILVQTRAIQLIKAALIIAVILLFTYLLNLNTLKWIMASLFPSLVIGIAIIFQPELRKLFTRIGQQKWFKLSSGVKRYHMDSIINSVEVLAMKKIGSLIVLSRNVGLKSVIESGTRIDAELSSSLILTIFSEGSPLHDGAVILQNDKVIAAGCFLPLSEQVNIKKSFGTRHRAALGLAEETDAVILVVSEENGTISLAYDANLLYDLSIEDIKKHLTILFELRDEEGEIS